MLHRQEESSINNTITFLVICTAQSQANDHRKTWRCTTNVCTTKKYDSACGSTAGYFQLLAPAVPEWLGHCAVHTNDVGSIYAVEGDCQMYMTTTNTLLPWERRPIKIPKLPKLIRSRQLYHALIPKSSLGGLNFQNFHLLASS